MNMLKLRSLSLHFSALINNNTTMIPVLILMMCMPSLICSLSSDEFHELTEVNPVLRTIYMENHCSPVHILFSSDLHEHIKINRSTIVKVSGTISPIAHEVVSEPCDVTFTAQSPTNHLLLHFTNMSITMEKGTDDRLRVFDGTTRRVGRELTPKAGLYGSYIEGVSETSGGGIEDYVSSGSSITLSFTGRVSSTYPGFTATLTEFTSPMLSGACPHPMSFKCTTESRCINSDLQCNGYSNCGTWDDSDTKGCNPAVGGGYTGAGTSSPKEEYGFNSTADLGLMIGCAVSIIILMVVVLWLGVVCLKRSRQLSLQRHYQRQLSAPDGVEGTIVEPSEIQNVMVPPQYFTDPPPPYTETSAPRATTPRNEMPTVRSVPSGRQGANGSVELPPPYSVVNESDNAGLLVNEQLFVNLPADSTDMPPRDSVPTSAPAGVDTSISPTDRAAHSSTAQNQDTLDSTSNADTHQKAGKNDDNIADCVNRDKDSLMLEKLKNSSSNSSSMEQLNISSKDDLSTQHATELGGSDDSLVSLDERDDVESASVC